MEFWSFSEDIFGWLTESSSSHPRRHRMVVIPLLQQDVVQNNQLLLILYPHSLQHSSNKSTGVKEYQIDKSKSNSQFKMPQNSLMIWAYPLIISLILSTIMAQAPIMKLSFTEDTIPVGCTTIMKVELTNFDLSFPITIKPEIQAGPGTRTDA